MKMVAVKEGWWERRWKNKEKKKKRKPWWGFDGDDEQKWQKFEPYKAWGKKGKRANKRKRGKNQGVKEERRSALHYQNPIAISNRLEIWYLYYYYNLFVAANHTWNTSQKNQKNANFPLLKLEELTWFGPYDRYIIGWSNLIYFAYQSHHLLKLGPSISHPYRFSNFPPYPTLCFFIYSSKFSN